MVQRPTDINRRILDFLEGVRSRGAGNRTV
jgi:hypothetical protein